MKNPELTQVVQYFKKNPNKNKYRRKEHHSKYSYLRAPDQKIIRLSARTETDPYLGKGEAGKVKKAESNNEVTCVKIQDIWDNELEAAQKEAKMNEELNVAKGPLIVVEKEYSTKVYQEMKILGEPLVTKYQDFSLEQKISIIINLILLMNNLHTGKLASSGLKLTHGDFHFGNVLINAHQELSLIDFSETSVVSDNELDRDHEALFLHLYHHDEDLLYRVFVD